MTTPYRRLLLKLSGEGLAGEDGYGIHPGVIGAIADQIREVHELGTEISIVIGRLWNRRKRKAASREAEAEKERRAARAARRAEAATAEPDAAETGPGPTEPDTTDGDGS